MMRFQWPRAILLDFYGTVVAEDEEPFRLICERIVAASRQRPSADEVTAHYVRIYSDLCNESHGPYYRLQKDIERESVKRLLARFEADLDGDRLAQTIIDYWSRPILFPEARSVLAQCRVPVCLVSNIDNAELSAAIAHHGLSFSATVTSEDCRAYKPRPELFQKALSIMGRSAKEVLHVGDSRSNDVRGAQEVGIPVLWINRNGRAFPADWKRSDYEARDLTGILAALARSN
jgi:2-haloacid dehalogenase/putative hydrolase of the HAD superfamily